MSTKVSKGKSRDIIQGETETFNFVARDSNGDPVDLTGIPEIRVCFKAGTTVIEKKKTVGSGVVVTDAVKGKFKSTLTAVDTLAMTPANDGIIETERTHVAVTDIRKNQITNAFNIILKACP